MNDWKYEHGDALKDAIVNLDEVKKNGPWDQHQLDLMNRIQHAMEEELGATADELTARRDDG